MEKGYRYYSIDMTMLDTPYEAGLGPFVRLGKGDFVGRDALRAAKESASAVSGRRLSTILIGAGDTYLPIYGGEAVRAEGEVIGRLRSVAQGPLIGRTIGYVYRSQDLPGDTRLTVDVFDERLPATLAPDVSWDPTGERMLG
jgi:dimethylglycine dehydrogenase